MSNPQRHVAILAGGGGTRLWPASCRQRPKQYMSLGPKGDTLLRSTFDRLSELTPPDQIWVITTAQQTASVREILPELPEGNIVAEPVARIDSTVQELKTTAGSYGETGLEFWRRLIHEAFDEDPQAEAESARQQG